MTMIDKGDLYTTAANLIRTHGLTKGTFARRAGRDIATPAEVDESCSLCAVGALRVALDQLLPSGGFSLPHWYPAVLDPLTLSAARLAEEPHSHLPSYSDRPDITADDVAALFERAAEIHRGETVEV